MSDQASMLYTVGGYATLLGLGYAVYHVSTQKSKKRSATAQPKTTRVTQPEVRKDDRKKKLRMEKFASEAQESSSKAPAEKTETAPAEPVYASSSKADDGVDNREFAKQLAKAKAGTTFSGKSDSGKHREKSVKQSRANQLPGAPKNKNKTTEAAPVQEKETTEEIEPEVDVQEPLADPIEPAPVDVSGVADMLEPAPAAPSILRITDTTSKDKPRVAKAMEPVESKKARQNRKKAEAAKLARQESEKERKVLEEKQRRTARIAEGRAAKDGSQFTAANGQKSAWTQGATNGTSNGATTDSALHQPLDTFEEVQKPAAADVKPAAPKKSEATWAASLPSEDVQMEMLKEEADEWSTVPTKASKKTSKKVSSGDSSDEAPQSRPAPAAVQQIVNGSSASRTASAKSFGSFSALTTKDEPAEEAEEEWDV